MMPSKPSDILENLLPWLGFRTRIQGSSYLNVSISADSGTLDWDGVNVVLVTAALPHSLPNNCNHPSIFPGWFRSGNPI